jgi:hypothetical protein
VGAAVAGFGAPPALRGCQAPNPPRRRAAQHPSAPGVIPPGAPAAPRPGLTPPSAATSVLPRLYVLQPQRGSGGSGGGGRSGSGSGALDVGGSAGAQATRQLMDHDATQDACATGQRCGISCCQVGCHPGRPFGGYTSLRYCRLASERGLLVAPHLRGPPPSAPLSPHAPSSATPQSWESCFGGTCCPASRVCGASGCCPDGMICQEGVCRAIGQRSGCGPGQLWTNDGCCNTQFVCGGSCCTEGECDPVTQRCCAKGDRTSSRPGAGAQGSRARSGLRGTCSWRNLFDRIDMQGVMHERVALLLSARAARPPSDMRAPLSHPGRRSHQDYRGWLLPGSTGFFGRVGGPCSGSGTRPLHGCIRLQSHTLCPPKFFTNIAQPLFAPLDCDENAACVERCWSITCTASPPPSHPRHRCAKAPPAARSAARTAPNASKASARTRSRCKPEGWERRRGAAAWEGDEGTWRG